MTADVPDFRTVTVEALAGIPVGVKDLEDALALQIIGHHLDDVRTVELTAWAEGVLGLDPVAPFPS